VTIRIYRTLEQGSAEWFQARCGLLTASEMKLIVTEKTLKIASNDKERAHLYELLAQRISGYVEPSYVGDNMLRGWEDEETARQLYSEHYALVEQVGFVTNDKWGFTLGASPDGLVGKDGGIECKSRIQKYQIQTVIEHLTQGTIPSEYALQVQTSMMVTERPWWDFISYSGGLPMLVIRCHPIPEVVAAIEEASAAFNERIETKLATYREALENARTIPTERREEEEIIV